MPIPLPGESRDDFVDRCIPIVIEDGTAEDGAQAFAVCDSLFDEPKQGIIAPPVNERGLTAEQTLDRVREQGQKFSKEEAGYIQPAPLEDASKHCSLCNFYAGVDGAGVQHCNVVSGGIEWFAHSDLFINAEQQQTITRENAGAMEDDMEKQEAGTMEHKTLPFIVTKIDEEKGIVEHTVAVMGNVDLGGDVIHPGAFTKTINERMSDIQVLDSHNTDSVLRVVGMPIAMREIGTAELPMEVKSRFPEANGALLAQTQFLIETPEGKGVFDRIKAKAVKQYSIGYEVLDVDFEEREVDGVKQTIRNLRTIKLYEYSPVIFAMNPATSTTGVKDAQGTDNKELGPDGRPIRRLGDVLTGSIHQLFTMLADDMIIRGLLTQEQRIQMSGAIGAALDALNQGMPEGVSEIQLDRAGDIMPFMMMLSNEKPEQKIGRAISAANAARMQAVIDGIQAALSNLEEMLQSAPEQADMHEDEEKQAPPETSESHQETPDEAGPDAEPPTSKIDLLAELDKHLADIKQMEAK